MGTGTERREARRFMMSLPLRVLSRDAKDAELQANTRDVSYRGLYFLADAEIQQGREIEFVITLPQQVSQAGEVKIRCRGQVVRVESIDSGHSGIAAKIDRYEFVPVTASASAA
ncbi:MAG TPA: PilZ domain-containing protein [Candidatus Dormibacteraeota bacterium]|nr:PilZ domain-containing protein [Candidatus Dormibacteraeota bacterium]